MDLSVSLNMLPMSKCFSFTADVRYILNVYCTRPEPCFHSTANLRKHKNCRKNMKI